MVLSQGVQSKNSSSTGQRQSSNAGEENGSSGRRGSNPSCNANHLENVKSVGIELRALLAAVDNIVPAFPTATHREVNLELISKLIKTLQYFYKHHRVQKTKLIFTNQIIHCRLNWRIRCYQKI